MTRQSGSRGAYWHESPWRYRVVEDNEPGAAIYSHTLRDVKADAADGRTLVVERRGGSKAAGYYYVFHSIINPPEPAVCAVPGCGLTVTLQPRPSGSVGWSDGMWDPFYCPKARDLAHFPELPESP